MSGDVGKGQSGYTYDNQISDILRKDQVKSTLNHRALMRYVRTEACGVSQSLPIPMGDKREDYVSTVI